MPILADADPSLLAIVIGNLLSNALRFARKEIWLRVVRAGACTHVEVDDDGCGIPESSDDIFERVNTTPKRSGRSGSGLGLAIVRGIAVAHGGSAFAENRKSEDGKTLGARFIVALPGLAG